MARKRTKIPPAPQLSDWKTSIATFSLWMLFGRAFVLWTPLPVIQVLVRVWLVFNALKWVNCDLGYSKSLLTGKLSCREIFITSLRFVWAQICIVFHAIEFTEILQNMVRLNWANPQLTHSTSQICSFHTLLCWVQQLGGLKVGGLCFGLLFFPPQRYQSLNRRRREVPACTGAFSYHQDVWCNCQGNFKADIPRSWSRHQLYVGRALCSWFNWDCLCLQGSVQTGTSLLSEKSLCCIQAFPSSFYFNDIFLQEKCWILSNSCESVFEIKISFLWRLCSMINGLLCCSAKEDIHIFQNLKEHINNWSCVLNKFHIKLDKTYF